MFRQRSLSFVLISTALALVLYSCNKKPESVSFPKDKTELLPPSSETLRFSEPKKFEWQVNDSTTFQKPVPIEVDLASVPSKSFYPDGFLPLDQPLSEMPFVLKQDTLINLQELPWESIKFKTSILEPPTRVKARLPKLNKNASVGIFEFGEDQGMPSAVVTQMMEDSHGMIWIATDKGICRFDGEYIEIYDIIDERFTGAQTDVLNMLEDEKGRIWIYTEDMGFYVIDVQVGIVINAVLVEDRFRFNLGNTMIMAGKNMIWFGTQNDGVFIVDPNGFSFKQITQLKPGGNGNVRQLVEDGFGKIWIGSDSGLFVIDPETGQVQTPGNQSSFSSSIGGLFCDGQNNIWLGTENEGITKVHSSRESRLVLGSDLGIQTPVHQFTEGNDGKIWMSADGGGVLIIDPITQKLKHLDKEKGLSDDRIILSFLDNSGQIWIATAKGLNLMDTEGLMPNYLTEEDGLSWPDVWAFMEDRKGDLWLGSWERMDIYDSENHAIKRVDLALQLEKNVTIPFQPMHMPSGNYLIKSPSIGLAIFNPDRSTITKITPENGLTNLFQTACFVDRSGKIWTGTFRNRGVEVYNPKTNSFKRLTNEEGLVGNIVWGIAEDALGQVWVGTDAGVNIINVEENTISNLMEGENSTTRNFGAFLTDKENRMWMGTRTGILIADQKNGVLTTISSENGLISSEVYTLYQHGDVMYAGTENGLTTFSIPANLSTDKSVLDIKSYAKEQGLIFNNFNADAAIAYDDKLWWGIETEVLTVTEIPKRDTVKGTTYISGIAISDQTRNFYDYDLAREAYTNLDTLFSAKKDTFFLAEQRPQESGWLKENDIQWDGLKGNYNLPTNLEIPYEQNYVSFQFTGAQLKNRNKTRYSYYLQGFDKEWSDLSPEPYSKNYRNLPAGNYTFHVQSKSFESDWSEPATFSFTILPHWTNTWWAWLLYVFIFIIVVSAIVQYRARALKKENAILEERVNHRTAQLKKSVEDLKSTQSQLIQSEKMASLGELTAGIAHEIQNPLNFVNNFSELNSELLSELKEELANGNVTEVEAIANDLSENEAKITHHGKRADAIVKGMLAHSRSGKGEKEPTDLNALAEEYLKLSYHGLRAKDKSFNADFKTDFDPNLPKVNIVPQDIGRVLLNLINNAFQACAERSRSAVSADRVSPEASAEAQALAKADSAYNPTVTVKTQLTTKGQILITIKDNGPGIPDDIKDKIFQPFFTTKPTGQGTGLGLSLSYDIVKAHGGDLQVESRSGQGTSFIVLLKIN